MRLKRFVIDGKYGIHAQSEAEAEEIYHGFVRDDFRTIPLSIDAVSYAVYDNWVLDYRFENGEWQQ